MLTGAAGFLGVLSGYAVNARGLGKVLLLTMSAIAAALAILGRYPDVFLLVVVSAIVFGAAFIFITGLLGLWSMTIFKRRPSAGFGLTFFLFTLGAAAGPSAGGIVADVYGSAVMFEAAALLALLPCLAIGGRRRPVKCASTHPRRSKSPQEANVYLSWKAHHCCRYFVARYSFRG